MKHNLITALNVDDVIRHIKKLFKVDNGCLILPDGNEIYIKWNNKAYEILLNYMNFCIENHKYGLKKDGFFFMGIRHYKGSKSEFEVGIQKNK